MKKGVVLGVLPIFFLFAGCADSEVDETIGGQRDEYGCLTPAGFSWNEEVGACIRAWELNEEQRSAAASAVASVDTDEVLTVGQVEAGSCEQCFTVFLVLPDDMRVQVEIKNGQVADENRP